MASEDYGVAIVRHKIKYSHLNDIFMDARRIFLQEQAAALNNSIISKSSNYSKLHEEIINSILLRTNNDGSLFLRSIAEESILYQIKASEFIELNIGDIGIALGTRDISTRLVRFFGNTDFSSNDSLDFFKSIIRNYDSVTRVVPNNVTLANAIKGRMASEGSNVMNIIQNWTDFLLIWELNHSWYENP